jgi:hypothetical protein
VNIGCILVGIIAAMTASMAALTTGHSLATAALFYVLAGLLGTALAALTMMFPLHHSQDAAHPNDRRQPSEN